MILGRLLTLFLSGFAMYVPVVVLCVVAGAVALLALVFLDRASLWLSLKLMVAISLVAGLVVFLLEVWLSASETREALPLAAVIASRWAISLVCIGYVLTGRFATDLILLGYKMKRFPIARGMACAIAIPFGWTGEAIRRQREVTRFRKPSMEAYRVPLFSPLIGLITDYIVLILVKHEAVDECMSLKA
jgi:hypothetical protein